MTKEELRVKYPDIAIETIWVQDPYFSWDGDGEDPRGSGYFPYDVEVRATRITNGELVEGSAHIGGSYSREGEHCPDINGNFRQLAREAIENCLKGI